jgi:hypothetical protein
MPEKHRHAVSSLRGEPFPAALNGPLPCRPPPDPLQSCLSLTSGPERNRNVSLSAASMARPSARRREKPGRYESRRTEKIRSQRAGTWQVGHRDWRFKDSGYATLPGSNGKRDLRKADCDWAREVEAHCAGLRSGPAFLSWNAMNNPVQGNAVFLGTRSRIHGALHRLLPRGVSLFVHSMARRSTTMF